MRLTRWLGSKFSPGGARGALSILIFHRVLAQPDPLFPELPDARRFDALLSWVGAAFSVLPLDQAIAALRSSTLPARALSITFDDGYADNFNVALPVLRRHRMDATFFVASGFIGGGRMWNDTVIEAVRRTSIPRLDLSTLGLGEHVLGGINARRVAIDRLLADIKYLPADERRRTVARLAKLCDAELPNDLMLDSTQLRALRAAGMLIGGHTRNHPILARLAVGEAFDEIIEDKARLESILGERITLFAYPNGKPGQDYDARHASMVRAAGYAAAVSTSPGVARRDADPFQLPRFSPWDRTPLRFGLRLVNNMRLNGEVAS